MHIHVGDLIVTVREPCHDFSKKSLFWLGAMIDPYFPYKWWLINGRFFDLKNTITRQIFELWRCMTPRWITWGEFSSFITIAMPSRQFEKMVDHATRVVKGCYLNFSFWRFSSNFTHINFQQPFFDQKQSKFEYQWIHIARTSSLLSIDTIFVAYKYMWGDLWQKC